MHALRASAALLLLGLAAATVGCMVPKGQAVVVDSRGGEFWSGYGTLVDRSADGQQCRVAVRSRALIVEKPWVPCRYVHERNRRP